MWNICGWSARSCSCVRSYSCHPAENPPRMKEHQQTILLWHHKQLQTINVPASRQPLPRRRAAASGGRCSLAQSCLRIALFPWFPLKTNRWRREAGEGREREILQGSYSFNMQAFQFCIWIFELMFLPFHRTEEEAAQLQSSPLNLFMCVKTQSGTSQAASANEMFWLQVWGRQQQHVQIPENIKRILLVEYFYYQTVYLLYRWVNQESLTSPYKFSNCQSTNVVYERNETFTSGSTATFRRLLSCWEEIQWGRGDVEVWNLCTVSFSHPSFVCDVAAVMFQWTGCSSQTC